MTESSLNKVLDEAADGIEQSLEAFTPRISEDEVGRVRSVSEGIVWAEGMGKVQSEELVSPGNRGSGLVLDILPEKIGIVLLNTPINLKAGDEVLRTGRILEVPVDESLVGRIIDPLGRPLDRKRAIPDDNRLPVFREAPPIMARQPVVTPLQTGIKIIDALIPIGHGQRELILGDRQTGKTAVAIDTIMNQRGKNVICIYCAIGQRSSSVARVVAEMQRYQALDYTVVVVAEGSDPPGLQYVAPYAATSMAEYFMSRGEDVLVVYDDLTRHAQALRQISLLMRRPPGREAFPGDIFFVHSRLLERSTRLRTELGGGSLTALPIIETEAQNISAYIPTNLISITDGQIYLSPELFQKGLLPAIDIGKSVSRVGGKAQLQAYRKVAGDLRLSYSQFQELESFARFGTRLDEKTKQTLAHGRRVREVLKQNQYEPQSASEQIAILFAVNKGLFDDIALGDISEAQRLICKTIEETAGLAKEISEAAKDSAVWDLMLEVIITALEPLAKSATPGVHPE